MKTIATIVLICFSVLSSFAQNPLKLSIIKGADKPNSETEHFYLLEVSNTSRTDFAFVVSANNKACSNHKLLQTDLVQEVYDNQKNKRLNSINVASGKTLEFYIKITRPKNAKQNSWNCTEIKAISSNGAALSNSLTIESLIPNPKDDN